jgi:transposase
MPLRDLSPEDVELIRDMYARRYGIGTIATKFGTGHTRIRELVKDVQQIPGPRRREESEAWEREAARRLDSQGKSVKAIARELQRPEQTVRHWLRPGAEETRAAYSDEMARLQAKKKRALELYDLGIYSINRVAQKVGSSWVTVEKWLKETGRIA